MVQSKGPGPGAYLLPTTVGYEKHDLRKVRQPQYSFGVRTSLRTRTSGPGPGNYYFGKMTRFGSESIPAFSFGIRTKLKYSDSGPGPGAYNISEFPDFKNKFPPAFSFGVKHIDFTKFASKTPGPNAYLYNVNVYKPSAPAFTINGRTKYKGPVASPGPAYNIPNLDSILPRSPAYSLGGRYIDIKLKSRTPGPNNYNVSRPGNSSPAFSFGVRHSPEAPPLILPCDN